MLEDHDVHPKLGRLKSRDRSPKLFVAQVLAAAQIAGHVGRSWPARSPAGHTRAPRGRGGVAAWRAAERRLYGNRARRVIVKARIVRQGFRAAGAVRPHLSYLRREGVTKDGVSARMFDAVSDEPDMEYAMIDATIVKVHRHGQGAKGGRKARPSAVRKGA